MNAIIQRLFYLSILVGFLAACGNKQAKQQFEQLETGSSSSKGISILYPSGGSIFPPEFPAPTFEWKDTIQNPGQWYLFISDGKGDAIIETSTSGSTWKPSQIEWDKLKTKVKTEFTFTVIGIDPATQAISTGRSNAPFQKIQ
jgi:hypothetical protein